MNLNQAEQSIMNALHDYDEDGDTNVSQNSEQEAATTESKSASTEASPPSKVESTSDTTKQQESTGATTQQTTQATQQEETKTVGPRRTTLKFDKDNNVVDDSGNILAKAGKERRMYESFINARDSASVLLDENKRLQQQIAHTQYVHGLPEKYKLTLSETESAIQLMQAFKTDPAKTLRDLVAQARAGGIAFDDEAAQQPLDINTIRTMIRSELNQGQQQRSVHEHTVNEGTEQAARFFAQFPDAHVQETEIARLMQSENCSPTEAYWKLKAYAVENGLDWTQPLIPQYLARQQTMQSTHQQQQPVQQQVSSTSQAPRVTTSPRVSQTVDNSQQQHAAATDSWSDIIRSAMREAYP